MAPTLVRLAVTPSIEREMKWGVTYQLLDEGNAHVILDMDRFLRLCEQENRLCVNKLLRLFNLFV